MSARTENIFQIVESFRDQHGIYGVVAVPMVQYQLVRIKDQAAPELEIGSGGRAWFLAEEVIAKDQAGQDRVLRQQIFPHKGVREPRFVGEVVSAIRARRIVVEGATWLNNITGGTTADTALKIVSGKFEPQGGTGEICGYIRRAGLAVLDSANSATGRHEIELIY